MYNKENIREHILVFDIETVPDDTSALNLINDNLDTLESRREALVNYHLGVTKGANDFLRQPFHKIVAISFLHCKVVLDEEGYESYIFKDLRSWSIDKLSEEEIVSNFFATIDKLNPRLISFNGRTFDVPVLKYRAMKYGISSLGFYKTGNKYESYSHRYSTLWHVDLLDVLSDFGLSARIKLNEGCSILGFPGKFGVDGSKVSEMYDKGEINAIANYCETDVLNTYLVYLRHCLHSCKINDISYEQAISSVVDFIAKNTTKQYLQDFYQEWLKSSSLVNSIDSI